MTGVVDSDSLPLNVGRETIQAHSSLKTIKKKLVRKTLEMLKKLSEEDETFRAEMVEGEAAKDEEEFEKKNKYARFWSEFGRAIRLGIIEDETNRQRLSKLLRFHSSKTSKTYSSLANYVSRMKPGRCVRRVKGRWNVSVSVGQEYIYYLCGQSIVELQKSPHLEKLLEKDYEVIYFVEPMDEYMMQGLIDFDDKRFMDASKEDLKLEKDDAVWMPLICFAHKGDICVAGEEADEETEEKIQTVDGLVAASFFTRS